MNFDKDIKIFIEGFQFNQALKLIWDEISDVDKAINNDEPWKITEKEKLVEKLECYVREIVKVAFELEPFLPETSKKIREQFISEQISSQPSLFPRI